MHTPSKFNVVVSNGSYKFHLAPLASELDRRNVLKGFITAGWPSGYMYALARAFPNSRGWKRLLDRYEKIDESKVYALSEIELIMKIGDVILRPRSQKLQQLIQRYALMWYSHRASKIVRKLIPHIYHYRNCYGQSSVLVARKLGIPTICDHSIAHPLCLHTMVANRGRYPTETERKNLSGMSRLRATMLEDLDRADYTIVNSDFVKRTCIHAGMDPSRIFVVYWGVDDRFFEAIPPFDYTQVTSRPESSLLFAGGWQRRKGVETLTTALEQIEAEWELQVIAGIEPELKLLPATSEFFSRRNVTHVGVIPRPELAAAMMKSRIFVFPSFCEGSARVIFEAMACGCYIITTPNAGSIVEDGIHGAVVPTGDAHALTAAINWALTNPTRISEIGWRNAELVRGNYRQSDYADRVLDVYESILTSNRIQS